MALDTFAHLQTAAADWLARTDLTSQIVDFIALAEAEMKRKLRRTSVRATMSLTAETNTLPADLAELRSIVLESGSPSSDRPLRIGTPEMLAERKARNAGSTGRPDTCCHIAGTLLVAPIPDGSYTARIVYFQQLVALSVSNPSNAVLVEAPDAYLFGTLLQAEPFLEHDDRIPVWREKFDRAIDQLNEVRDREEYNASIRDVRLPRVFG